MRLKIVMAISAALLLAACSSKPADTGGGTTGGTTGGSTTTTMAPGADQPGSTQDFITNIGDRVFFGTDRSDLTQEAQAELQKQATWLKAHAIVGTTTNVIASVKVTDSEGADSPQLPGLVEAAKQRFELGEVSADKAYLGHDNLKAIETAGASPFIPFKLNSQADGPAVWRKMHAVFMSRKNSSPPTRSGTTSRARSRR